MNTTATPLTPDEALDKLEALYDDAVNALREAIAAYINEGRLPDETARAQGLFVYRSCGYAGMATAAKRRRRALTGVSPIRGVTPPPLRVLGYFAVICANS